MELEKKSIQKLGHQETRIKNKLNLVKNSLCEAFQEKNSAW
jgi:hypothetical protein